VTPAQAEPEQAHGSPRSESGRSHGHGHGHTPAPPAGRRVRILLAALLAPAAVAALVGLVLLWPAGPAPASQAATATPVHAQVIETRAAPCDDAAVGAGGGPGAPIGAGGNQPGGDGAGSAGAGGGQPGGAGAAGPSGGASEGASAAQSGVGANGPGAGGGASAGGAGGSGCVALVVHMADGPRANRDLVQLVPVEPSTPRFGVGDPVVLSWSGGDPDDPGSYQVVDFQRGGSLWWLAALFAAAVLALGRWRGLAALAALGLSFVVLLLFVLPAILAGHDPLWVAIVGACLIMFAVLYLTHGPSARTSTAVLGTLVSLLLIGGLSAAFTALARLTGLDETTSALIGALGTGVDARGLLLAGVLIGALGVLDDVTVTQTSAVWELHGANPTLGARGLFTAAMRIGRDHVSSAVNTLVLAYAGASLPLMLIFSVSGRGLGDVVTTEEVATEIVRTLVGSIGLVASVPITTAVAAVVASRETAD
jgi:uncharacterized membrane protein